MPRLFFALLLGGLATAAAAAQAPPSGVDSARPLVVMNLAAHPDDEDGPTLAYYRGNRDAITYSVIYTRGEGGQNEAGPELYERLGAIRSRETEAAARTLGTQALFLNHFDFGFSKHAREAFAEWGVPRRSFWEPRPRTLDLAAGRDSVTARIVYLYRKHKPDVVFTNHDTVTVGDDRQHGHHQAVGISGFDAFALAADPTYHPEQLRETGVDLWQPKRLFLRRGGFSLEAPEVYDVAVPVAETCAATTFRPEESCADRAVAAAALHVSQGFDKFAPRFYRETTYYQLLRQSDDAPPLPSSATDLAAEIEPPEESRGMTWAGYVDAGRIAPIDELQAPAMAVPGEVIEVRLPHQGPLPKVAVFGPGHQRGEVELVGDSLHIPILVVSGAKPTQPAHARQYERFESAPPLTLKLDAPDGSIRVSHLPTEIAPASVTDLSPDPARLAAGANPIEIEVTTFDPTTPSVRVFADVYWDGPGRSPIATASASADTTLGPGDHRVSLDLDMGPEPPDGPYVLRVETRGDEALGNSRTHTELRYAAVLPDVRVSEGLRVGFVRSYDGAMAEALSAMGAEVVDLDSLALATGDFDGLHTVVIDIRAYLDRKDLRVHNANLLGWVREGGHLVVGYQKLFEWNAGRPHPLWPDDSNPADGFAPYPLQLGRERITMEDAPVTVTAPDHLLFNAPYEIADADWGGWVQERGLYFPTDDADPRYARPLAMADTGETPLTTAILLADVGEGTYLYSPLVWYRQLAALNPGAWRMFANLVSLPLTDGRTGTP